MNSSDEKRVVWQPADVRTVELISPVTADEAENVYRYAYDEKPDGADRVIPGFMPLSFLYLARDPELAKSIATIARRYLRPGGRVNLGLKNMVAHLVSSVAGCRYCATHQGYAAVNRSGVSTEKFDALWDFESSPMFDDAERAALRFAAAAATSPSSVNDRLSKDMQAYFDEDQIFEVVTVVSFFGFMNRWNDTFATPLETRMADFGDEHLAEHGWDVGSHKR